MKISRRVMITLGAVALAFVSAFALYLYYNAYPWTRDGQVRANIVGVAPRVAGPVLQIPVKDNQPVKKGDLLFEIDPSTYQAALDETQADLQKAEAELVQATQELQRQEELFKKNVTDKRDLQNAQDSYSAANANVASLKAEVQTAQLNLGYTKVYAPVDGFLTNVDVSPGTYVDAGQQLLALVDSTSFWIAAYFKETHLASIKPGDRAVVRLMGHSSHPIEAEVQSTGWAIYLPDGSAVDLLPEVSQTIDWVRLPQRFPVRVELTGTPPVPLRMGQTASVVVRGK